MHDSADMAPMSSNSSTGTRFCSSTVHRLVWTWRAGCRYDWENPGGSRSLPSGVDLMGLPALQSRRRRQWRRRHPWRGDGPGLDIRLVARCPHRPVRTSRHAVGRAGGLALRAHAAGRARTGQTMTTRCVACGKFISHAAIVRRRLGLMLFAPKGRPTRACA
jgi:hypothetical protein